MLTFAPQIRSTYDRFGFLNSLLRYISLPDCTASLTYKDLLKKNKHSYMKSEAKGIVMPINKNEMRDLMKETKETLAADVIRQSHEHRTFSTVDLWNARKNQRTMASMRRCN